MTKGKTLPRIVLFSIVLIGLGLFYHQPLLEPNSTFMGGGHDGLKNYYTPWYHAQYDSTYTWFEGMNYPYGDHVVFADAQPLLSNSIKFLGLADWTVGIINYVLILSLFLTAWLLFQILRRWQVNPWWAALSAAAITLLSPQLVKMNGHYALAYAFAVPLVWYLALRFFETPSVRRSLAIALPIFLMGWLHPYFVMISAVFLAAMWLFHTLLAWRSLSWGQKFLHFTLQVILPVALFTLCLKLTDPITDRPENPFGIDEYVATWRTIFMPLTITVLHFIPKAIWKELPDNWEGMSYVGFAAGLMFVGFWTHTVVRLIRSLAQRRLRNFTLISGPESLPVHTRKLIAVSVLAGLAVGIFSCGFPFAIKPELLTELFPPIKQFRSLGRFSWVFYYTWVTFSFFLFWQVIQWLRRKNLVAVGVAVGVIVVGWTLFEGGALNEGVRRRIWVVKLMTYKDTEPGMIPGMKPSPWMASIEPEKYSALVAVPYFHEGSENLRANDGHASKMAFEASIRTGLPLLDVMMSRISLTQAWSHLQLITEPNAPLEILAHWHDPRPVLVMRFGRSPEFDGAYVQRTGEAVYQQDTVELYALDLRALQDRLLQERHPVPDSLWDSPTGLKTHGVDSSLVWDDFEAGGTGPGYRSPKGKTLQLKDNNFLYQGPLKVAAGDTIVVSLWLKMRGDRLPLTILGYEEWRGATQVEWDYLSLHNNIRRLEGDWALCEREFVVQDPQDIVFVNVTRWKRLPPEVVVDNLLIRRKGTDVYRFEAGRPVWKNNRYMLFGE